MPSNSNFYSGTENTNHPSSLTSLAARLHKKSVLLAQERNTLRELQDQITETQAMIDETKQSNREVRRQELHQIIAQHQAELNFFEAQDELARVQSSKEQVEEETRGIKEENDRLQTLWNHDLETVFAPHELLLQGFLQRLQMAFEVSNQKQETLDRLRSSTRLLNNSRKEMLKDHRAMFEDLTRLKQEEREGGGLISKAAIQVKQALAQVRMVFGLSLKDFRVSTALHFASFSSE